MKDKIIQVGGRKVAYSIGERQVNHDKVGTSKPVFLLHGWGGSKESWKPLLDELQTDGLNTYISVDFPGFGESEEPARGWEVNDYAHWFEHFIASIYKEENLSGDYDLIVHSFGGRVLMKLYSEEFEHSLVVRPDKLILIAAAGIKHQKSFRVQLASVAARTGKAILTWPILSLMAPLAQKVLYKALRTHDYEKSSGVMRETFLKVIDEDLSGSIDQIHRPTMIVWGDKDTYVPVEDAYHMNEKISPSELHIIEGGRHGIHKTHAKIVAGFVREFLNK